MTSSKTAAGTAPRAARWLPSEALSRQPPISSPEAVRNYAPAGPQSRPATPTSGARRRSATQPRYGLLGGVVVAAVTAVLLFAVGDASSSLTVLAPLVTFTLPAVAVVAFWWQDWPGTQLRSTWAGPVDLLIVAACGVVLTFVGQGIDMDFDPRGVFLANPGPGHVTAYPTLMPLGACVFTVILQFTLVQEGYPLRGLGRIWGGLAVLTSSWIVAVALDLGLVHTNLVSGPALASCLGCIGVAQVLGWVALNGAPFSSISSRRTRLLVANGTVVGLGVTAYLLTRYALDAPGPRIGAVTGAAVAATLVVAMLFEAWPGTMFRPAPGRTLVVVISALLTWLGYVAFHALAGSVGITSEEADDWVSYAVLDGVSAAVILHVAVFRRWPLRGSGSASWLGRSQLAP